MGWGGVCLSPNLKIQVTLKSMHQKELKTTSQNLIAQNFQENLFLSLSLPNPNILLCLLSIQSYPYTYTCQVGTCGGAEPWAARYRVFYDSKLSQREHGGNKQWKAGDQPAFWTWLLSSRVWGVHTNQKGFVTWQVSHLWTEHKLILEQGLSWKINKY